MGILQLAEDVHGIVSIRRDLPFDMIPAISRRYSNTLSFGPIRSVLKNIREGFQASNITQTGEHESRICAYMPVLAGEHVFEIFGEISIPETNNLPGNF